MKLKAHNFLYKTTCVTNGKYYIGMHSTDKLNDRYIGSGKHLQNSIRKYGKHNFRIEILEHFPDRESLRLREIEVVDESVVNDPLSMNLQKGGGGFNEHTEDAKIRIGNAAREKWKDLEFRESVISKIKKHHAVPENKEKFRKFKGKKHTPEALAAIRESKIGKPLSDEHRESIRQTLTGTHLSDETKRKMSQTIKGTNSASRYKHWIIKDPNGKIHTVECVTTFCEKMNIAIHALRRSFETGHPCRIGITKGWQLLEKIKKND